MRISVIEDLFNHFPHVIFPTQHKCKSPVKIATFSFDELHCSMYFFYQCLETNLNMYFNLHFKFPIFWNLFLICISNSYVDLQHLDLIINFLILIVILNLNSWIYVTTLENITSLPCCVYTMYCDSVILTWKCI